MRERDAEKEDDDHLDRNDRHSNANSLLLLLSIRFSSSSLLLSRRACVSLLPLYTCTYSLILKKTRSKRFCLTVWLDVYRATGLC